MRLIVGISGTTGVQIGYRLLEMLSQRGDIEVHLVVSEGAKVIFDRETDVTMQEVEALADVVWDNRNLAAAISSGSFVTDGMIVAPCSMKSLSAIANAYDDDLLVRAADVCAKERRKVVLVPREMPHEPCSPAQHAPGLRRWICDHAAGAHLLQRLRDYRRSG